MKIVPLKASRRDRSGKGSAGRVRRTGFVPGIVYGQGVEPLNIQINAKELGRLIHGAQHSIHAMTFILGRDPVGRAIVEALAAKAREGVKVLPDGFGNIPKTEGVSAMQCGITLAFGKHKGRLIMPARVMGPKSSNAVEWRPYHYSTALYSDDGGTVWHWLRQRRLARTNDSHQMSSVGR